MVALLVVTGGVVATIAMRGVGDRLEAGRAALEEGRGSLSRGDFDEADERFAEARERFDQAQSESGSGIAGILARMPVLGRNVVVARGLADAGTSLAEAGEVLTAAGRDLPEEAPADGAIPLDEMAPLAAAAEEAAVHTAEALEAVESTPSGWLAGPVAYARSQAAHQTQEIQDALEGAGLILEGLPSFAGADGPRRYFFAAESPAEARGTGGLWGAFAIVTAEDGRFTFSEFRPIQTLQNLDPEDLPAPNPEFDENYGQWGGAGFWRSMNMTPDFPSAARAVLAAYEEVNDERLDGVIAADPFALRDLLAVTGPAQIPGIRQPLDADNVVAFTQNLAYLRFEGEAPQRKEILGEVAAGIFGRFLAMPSGGIDRVRTLGGTVAGGHLKLYAPEDPALQEGLTILGADAALSADEGDLLSVVVNSASGTKIDYYATRRIEHEVRLGGPGEAIGTTTITIRNDAPASGLPPYVIGPIPGGASAGENVSLVTLSCAPGCSLVSADRNGRPVELGNGSELGFPWFRDFFATDPGTTSSLRIQTWGEDVWEGDDVAGRYRLTFLNQTTVQPTSVGIAIHAPSGQRITWASEPMEVRGGSAFWRGTPGPRLTLEVRFSAPAPLGWWRRLTAPLG